MHRAFILVLAFLFALIVFADDEFPVIGYIDVQSGDGVEVYKLRIISNDDAESKGRGLVQIALPDPEDPGSVITGSADLVLISNPLASPVQLHTGMGDDPDGNYAWRHSLMMPPPAPCPEPWSTVTDIDGNVYETVQIGDQCWMAENLKAVRYRTGAAITFIEPWDPVWETTTSGAYCNYDSPSFPDTTLNVSIYGRLYNGFAVDDARGLCPTGWRMPSDDDWKVLEEYLGMDPSELDGWWLGGTNEGSKIAGNEDLWSDGALKSDPEFGTSGFNALPGGYRYAASGGMLSFMGAEGYFWSSTRHFPEQPWYRACLYHSTQRVRASIDERYGFSVRCLLDE